MNCIHRIVFNHALGLFQAVSKRARGRGKSRAVVCAGLLALAVPPPIYAQSVIIDDDDHEIVDGRDPMGGSGGTRPSPWDIDDSLSVGETSEGSLAIVAGGRVSSTVGYIAFDKGSSGTVTVSGVDTATGAASTWDTNSWELYVGSQGAGALSIEDGGRVLNRGAFIGARLDSNSTVRVRGVDEATGKAATWVNEYLSVGGEGAGHLFIEDGGQVISGHVTVGDSSGSDGMLLISGQGALETGYIGKGGGSARLALDGGILRASGDEADFLRNFGAGDVIFGASGAFVDSNAHHIGIGAQLSGPGGLTKIGNGTLTLSGVNTYAGGTTLGAGVLSISSDANLGQADGGLIFAGGALATTASLASDRPIILNSYGQFDVAGSTTLQLNGSIAGSATLYKDGAGTLNTTGGVDIDNMQVREGMLRMEDGTNLVNATVWVTTAPGGQAKLVADGQDTSFQAATLSVAYRGAGSFELTDGAQADILKSLVVGEEGDAEGQVLISGSNSRLRVDDYITNTKIGRQAQGRLTVEDGGRFESGYGVAIGDGEDGIGHVTVSGSGSTFATTGVAPTYVGNYGRGALRVLDGGQVDTAFSAILGRNADSEGSALVQGSGSIWTVDSNLHIGESGKGAVVVGDGGHINVSSFYRTTTTLGRHEEGEGTLAIGAQAGAPPGGSGTIDTDFIRFGPGSGKLIFNHTDENYVFAPDLQTDASSLDPSGTHSIAHLAGHTVYRGNGSEFDGITTISGGTFTVDGRLGGAVDVLAGGALGGSGRIGSTTVADGGIVAPGNSIGTLTVAGNLALSPGSVLNYELGAPGGSAASPGASDRISVTGDLTLDGTLNLAQSGDAGDGAAGLGYYRLMTYGGDLQDNGLTVGHHPGLDAGYDIRAGDSRVDLFIGAMGDDMLQHWQGGDGVWSATNPQWLNKDGDLPAVWAGNHAVFKNQPGGFNGGTIDVEGMQRFAGLQFVDEGYRLQGTGALETIGGAGSEIRVLADRAEIATQIAGAGGITKTEAGTLVLSGNNTYAGGTMLAGGAVSVSSDANLGHADGALAFDGGVLQITGTDFNHTGRQIVWGARGGGFDIAHKANHFYADQNIFGPGDLVKRGDGTLTLAGDNRYGNTRVEAGRLLGDAGSISGDIANAGAVTFFQDDDARFTGDITGLDGIDGAMIKDGAGSLTLKGQSLLDWSIASGTLMTGASRFAGNAQLDGATAGLTFTDGENAVYGGVISGIGQFRLDGSGMVRLTGDSSQFAGTTVLSNGTLLVGDADGQGSLGGSLVVLAGATLGGSGTAGAGTGSRVTVASGGTLAPGNSIGTLTVDGDLVFEPGSRFEVEVDPQGTDSDRVVVTGKATLRGGSVVHVGANGHYGLRSAYTILTAGGGLSGAFDEVSSDFAFLTPDLTYDYGAGTVELELARNERDFASVALTRNQSATADGIESIGVAAGHAVYDAIAHLPDNDSLIRNSLDALSGEIHASTKTALIEDSRFVRNAANDRVRAAFATPGSSKGLVHAYGPAQAPTQVSASDSGPVVWSQAFGSWGSTDSDGNAADLDRDAKGLLIGADRRVGDWRLGLLAGYSRSDFKAHDRASSGKSDNYHLGFYGGAQWNALGLRAGLAYTWHDIDTERSISIPGLDDSAQAGYHAGTMQAFGELGYSIDAGAARLEPYAGLAHVRLHTDGYGERGGAAALSGGSADTEVTFSTLGLRAEHRLDAGDADFTLRAAVGWRHAFGDTTPAARHGFSAGNAFTVAGVPIAEDSAIIEAGVDLNPTPDATFGFSYVGQLAGSSRDHGVKASLAIRF